MKGVCFAGIHSSRGLITVEDVGPICTRRYLGEDDKDTTLFSKAKRSYIKVGGVVFVDVVIDIGG